MTPACFRLAVDGKQLTQCVEVSSAKAAATPLETKSCPAWLVGNAGGRGHYVVRYGKDLAARIRASFRGVPRQEAVALVGDVALLARSGLLPMDDAFAWAGAALRHPSPIVKMSAVQLLLAERDEWLTPSQLQEKRRIVSQEVAPLALRTGWIERTGEGEDVRMLRTVLLPFAADSDAGAALRPAARALALRWIANRAAVSSNMAGPALDTAARYADDATYARLEAALVAIQDQRNRRTLLDAIAKVRDPRLRELALAIAFMKKEGAEVLNGGQAHDLLSFAAMDDASRAAALHFVSANFDAIDAKIPNDSEAWLIDSFAGLCAPAERDAFRAFFAPRAGSFLGGDLAFRQTLEAIDLCVAARAG